MSGAELLEIGEARRQSRFRRAIPALVVVAAVLAVLGLLGDRLLREREEQAVSACADAAATAVDLAGRPVHAAYEYIRPVLANGPGPSRKDAYYLLVAKAARGAAGDLVGPSRSCRGVAVLPLHEALAERRDRCVEVLDAQRSWLDAIAGNGESVQGWMETPRTC